MIKKKNVWEKIVDTQMHFNEMLLRLRTFGLSAVVSIMGAGIFLNKSEFIFQLTPKLFILGFIVVLIIYAILLFKRFWIRYETHTERVVVISFYILALFMFIMSNINIVIKSIEIIKVPIGILIISSGFLLLTSLYLMDRFYYFKLLVASVRSAEDIEENEDAILCKNISSEVPLNDSINIITYFYGLPAFGGITIIF